MKQLIRVRSFIKYRRDIIFLDDVYKQKYENIYNTIYRDLKDKKDNDPNYGFNELEALLEDLYIIQGNSWDGKSEIKNIAEKAKIAACQAVLGEWKNELSPSANN